MLQVLPLMLLRYMMTYCQCLKSGSKPQKTNNTVVEVTKLGGKVAQLENVVSLKRKQSQFIGLLNYLAFMSSSLTKEIFGPEC